MARRLLPAIVLICASLFPCVARAHAHLVSSEPAAGTTLHHSPPALRLTFSEPLVPSLCRVSLAGPDGRATDLTLRADPRDASALLADFAPLAAGEYRVSWSVVSKDGHPVQGSFAFSVAAGDSTGAGGTAAASTTAASGTPPGSAPYPFAAAIFRGLGMSALLALAGLLWFGRREEVVAMARLPWLGRKKSAEGARVVDTRGVAVVLALAAGVFLVVHFVFWVKYVEPAGTGLRVVLASFPGRMEALRAGGAVLSLVTLVLSRRRGLALFFAAAALAATCAIGHPVTVWPVISVTALALHLIAAAAWLGGLIWLVVLMIRREVFLPAEASRVSNVAFVAAIVVTLSGILASVAFLTGPYDLFTASYGRLLLVKIAGLFALIVFGWHHRFRALPALSTDAPTDFALSLRYEIIVMLVVILVAAFLSYTPLPG